MIRRLMVILLVVLGGAAAAAAQGPADAAERADPIAVLQAAAAKDALKIKAWELREARLKQRETRLNEEVAALKRRPSSILRDAQLRKALKEAREIARDLRTAENTRNNLETALLTKHVAMADIADRQAEDAMERAGDAFEQGDDAGARRHYAVAFRNLRIASEMRPPPEERLNPETLPALPPVYALQGDETPRELREVALIHRDTAEKIGERGRELGKELLRLWDERDFLRGLIALDAENGRRDAEELAWINARVAWMERQMEHHQGMFRRLTAEAALLERRAEVEERALLSKTGEGP